jgi:hypothetical protein
LNAAEKSQGVASDIQVGDRVRVTAKSRVRRYAAGETGIVLRISRRAQAGEVNAYVVRMDRDGAVVAFYPGEVEGA